MSVASAAASGLWRALYQTLLLLAWPWVWLRLTLKGRSERRAERFGFTPASVGRGAIWFHTVSAGETIAAAPLVRQLQERLGHRFLVTTTTRTGSEQVRKLYGTAVEHCYAPYDFPWAVDRFLDRAAPRALLLMETELWPNLLRKCRERSIPTFLLNARLSAKSARGYRRIGGLTRSMLADLDGVYCQYADHEARFLSLGAPRESVAVTGSIKFDLDLPGDLEPRGRALRESWAAGRPVWIAGSTHRGEDAVLLQAHGLLRRRHPELLLLLVPRHPERFGEVIDLARDAGFQTARMTEGARRTEVVVGDVMGQLLYLFGMADVAFIGGSLVDTGGHNPIEAAVHGLPLLMGPSRFNFTEVARLFADAGCLHEVVDAKSIAAAVDTLLADTERRRDEGVGARRVVAQNAGATARLVAELADRLR